MDRSTEFKSDLKTPCLVLDLDILDANMEKMKSVVSEAGKHLRPHAKTHKCSALARRQIEAGATGICAAKVSEAEKLIESGISGILITGPVASQTKVNRIIDILVKDPSLMIVVDHAESVDLLAETLQRKGLSMGVLMDVDVGLNRTGVSTAEAIKLSRHICSHKNLRLMGIQAYAGHVQHIPSYDTRKNESQNCLREAVELYNQIKSRIRNCSILSTSGTGTFDIDVCIPEVTELQAGSYVFMDAEYLSIGSAENSNQFTDFGPALSLHTTVVSANHTDFVTVDAGLKSLYRDGAVPQIITPAYAELTYDWFGDEYGRISRTGNRMLPPLGTVLEMVTSHCDPTVNLFDRYYLTRGDRVAGTWPIDLRGCSQ